jgi:hypothetical protein
VAKVDSIGLVVRRWIQVLGGVVVERQQHVEVVGDLGDRLGPLGAVGTRPRMALCMPQEWEDSPGGYPQTPPYQWWRLHEHSARTGGAVLALAMARA